MQTFSLYFYAFLATTVETLILLLLFMIVLEVADSVHFLYRHFLPKTTERSLNDFYYACFCWTMLHITNRITSMATALSVLCVTLLSGMDRKFLHCHVSGILHIEKMIPKLSLVAYMVRQMIQVFRVRRSVIILCDSW